MEVKEYVAHIVEKGNAEDMHKLSDMFSDLVYDLKIKEPEIYKKYKMCLYELAYGKVILEDKATKIVHNMKPYGEHYTLTQIKNMIAGYNTSRSAIDFYLVMNSLYNDYHDIFGEDDETYKRMAIVWLEDEDSVEDKVYSYFMYIPKRD